MRWRKSCNGSVLVELPKIKASRGRKESLRSIAARFDGVVTRLELSKRYFQNVGNKFNSTFDNEQFFAYRTNLKFVIYCI